MIRSSEDCYTALATAALFSDKPEKLETGWGSPRVLRKACCFVESAAGATAGRGPSLRKRAVDDDVDVHRPGWDGGDTFIDPRRCREISLYSLILPAGRMSIVQCARDQSAQGGTRRSW